MKKMVTPHKNNYVATGIIVKNDAFVNAAQTVAHFRLAVSTSVDAPSVFWDCVMFSGQDRTIPVDLLKRGAKIAVSGYFQMNTPPATDAYPTPRPRVELVVVSVQENEPVEVEIPDDDYADVMDIPKDAAASEIEDLPEDIA